MDIRGIRAELKTEDEKAAKAAFFLPGKNEAAQDYCSRGGSGDTLQVLNQ